ncbi:uncharacterized protein LOC108210667 isoform X2 [Daucus carota subsp. sativus]|uniref:uncharacterized protein LOC108210667 isoform X2 n=1 Tax=Daucus carota subsp. sativus TaxID=79200 RepID=UPI00308348AD
MAGKDEKSVAEEYVYRISTAAEWEALQSSGSIFGGELDKSTGCIHLSNLNQVQPTLKNFFPKSKTDLYLLQIDAKKEVKPFIAHCLDGFAAWGWIDLRRCGWLQRLSPFLWSR